MIDYSYRCFPLATNNTEIAPRFRIFDGKRAKTNELTYFAVG